MLDGLCHEAVRLVPLRCIEVAATVPSLDELLAELERPADAGEDDED